MCVEVFVPFENLKDAQTTSKMQMGQKKSETWGCGETETFEADNIVLLAWELKQWLPQNMSTLLLLLLKNVNIKKWRFPTGPSDVLIFRFYVFKI